MAHEIHEALNANCFEYNFIKAMQKAWCRETCWEDMAAQYDARKNPALGQCLVTTLAAWADEGFQDIIQTVLVKTETHPFPLWHFNLYYSRRGLYEFDADLTRQQFPRGSYFETVSALSNPRSHHEIIYGSLFEPRAAYSLERRLNLFVARLESEGRYKLEATPAQIIARAEQQFCYVWDWARKHYLPLNRPRPAPPATTPDSGSAPPAPGF